MINLKAIYSWENIRMATEMVRVSVPLPKPRVPESTATVAIVRRSSPSLPLTVIFPPVANVTMSAAEEPTRVASVPSVVVV